MSIIDGPESESKKSTLKRLHRKASEKPVTTYWKNSAGKSVPVHLIPVISAREIRVEIEGIGSFVAYPVDFENILKRFGFRFFDKNESLY